MKFQIISPNFHKVMAASGFFWGIVGGLLLWLFIWIKLHWVALYLGGGTFLAGILYILLSFYTEEDSTREENYKKGQGLKK